MKAHMVLSIYVAKQMYDIYRTLSHNVMFIYHHTDKKIFCKDNTIINTNVNDDYIVFNFYSAKLRDDFAVAVVEDAKSYVMGNPPPYNDTDIRPKQVD
jgi:hypothetical protein